MGVNHRYYKALNENVALHKQTCYAAPQDSLKS